MHHFKNIIYFSYRVNVEVIFFKKNISKYKKYKKNIKDIWTNGQKMHRKKIREQSVFKFLGDEVFACK
jgi:hypothetical protein